MKKEDYFKVFGKVLEKETKRGILGLIVEALDKDLCFDDRLGSVITDKDGNFELKYDREDFQELFFDRKPDIYLRVKSPDGKIIYSTEDKVRYEAGKTEAFIVNIPRELTGKEEKEMKLRFQVVLFTPTGGIIEGKAKVTLIPLNEKKQIHNLQYNKRSRRFEITNITPGLYSLTAEAEGGLKAEREVEIGKQGGKVIVNLGKEGMPYYYAGDRRIYFEPPQGVIGILFERGASESKKRSVLALPLLKELNAKPVEKLPDEADLTDIAALQINREVSDDLLQQLRTQLIKYKEVKDILLPISFKKGGSIFLTSEIIVRFRSEVEKRRIYETAKKYQLEVVREFSYAPSTFLLISKVHYGLKLLDVANSLAESDLTVYAEPNLHYTMEDDLVPGDYLYDPHQWHLPLILAEDAWDITRGSHDITICVHDRGLWIDADGNPHPDFDSSGLGWDKIHSPWDFQDMDDETPYNPVNNHGTMCCGVATAIQNGLGVSGLAPDCRLIPTRRFDSNTTDEHADAYIWASGFDPGSSDPDFPDPPDHPADVIVSSFGSNGLALSGLMKDAFDFITTYGRGGKGCVMIFSAGNGYGDVALREWASYEKTIAVAASTNADVKADSSNYGEEIDVCAPSSGGTDAICTTDFVGGGTLAGSDDPGASLDYVDTFGGTSSAAPLVAGLAGLILSANPNLTWVEVRDILRSTAEKIDAANTDINGEWVDINGDRVSDSGLDPYFSNWYGYGRINAQAAVEAAQALVGVDPLDHIDTWIKENSTDVGDVPESPPYWSPDVWVRNVDPALDDPAHVDEHQSPIREQDNWVYAIVRNRGDVDSHDVYVRFLITRWAGTQYIYPDDFIPAVPPSTDPMVPMTTGSYFIGEEHVDSIPAHSDVTINVRWPEELIPPESVEIDGVVYSWADSCLLVEVSPHDGPTPTGDNTWDNNNLCQKNITIVDPPEGEDDLAIAFVVGHRINNANLINLRIDRKDLPGGVKLLFDYVNRDASEEAIKFLDRVKEEPNILHTCNLTILTQAKGEIHCPWTGKISPILITPNTRLSLPCCCSTPAIADYRLEPVAKDARMIFQLPTIQRAYVPILRRGGEYQVVALHARGLKNLEKGEYQIDVYQQDINGKMDGGLNFIIQKR